MCHTNAKKEIVIATAANTLITVEITQEGSCASLQQSDLPDPFLVMVMEHLSQGIDITSTAYQEGLYRAIVASDKKAHDFLEKEELSPAGASLVKSWSNRQ